jgi:O-antigen ligase/tetratricopeptide (TPR) repeat protein
VKAGTRNLLQHGVSIAIVLAMVIVPDGLFSFGSRVVMAVIACLAVAAICSRRLRDAYLLVGPLDYGLLPFIWLTGITVLLSASPRRSLESWLWLSAIQLPIGYGALYVFRRGWHIRTVYRALLVVVGCMYVFAAMLTLNYLSQSLLARADGIAPPGFRLWGITNHPNIFAMIIVIATPCMAGYLFVKMGRIERIAVGLWLVGAVVALFGTGSRTGLIATVIGVAVGLALALLAHPAQLLSRFRKWVFSHRRQAAGIIGTSAIVGIIMLAAAVYLQFGRPMQDDGGGRLGLFKSAVTMFIAHPLVGMGPGGFVRNEAQTHSIPPWRPLQHAHNMYLNVAAESGLAGILGFIALFAVAAWTCVVVWRKYPSARPLIAGPVGGLVGFGLNGLLDSPINQFGAFALATILLTFIVAMLPPPTSVHPTRMKLIVASIVSVVLVLGLVLIPYAVQWDDAQPDRPVEEITALATKARQLDTMMAYDSYDPLITLQAAYRWAAVAERSGRADALQSAIARFERGVQLDPDLGINYLNLSVLYTQAERLDDAVWAAQQATEHSSLDGVAWLNLGLALEKTGSEQDAQAAYVRALQLEPWWSAAGFWQVSPMRRTARTQYLDLTDRAYYYEWLFKGDVARQSGLENEAVRAYAEALKVAPGPVATAYTQGLIALSSGDLVGARTHLLGVTAMDIVEMGDQVAFANAWLELGDLARDQDEMLQNYRTAYGYLTTRGLGGFGTKNSHGYAISAYQRYGQVTDYLPGVVMLDITPGQAVRFRALARDSVAHGNPREAVDIYRYILQSNPDDADAKAAMAELLP